MGRLVIFCSGPPKPEHGSGSQTTDFLRCGRMSDWNQIGAGVCQLSVVFAYPHKYT